MRVSGISNASFKGVYLSTGLNPGKQYELGAELRDLMSTANNTSEDANYKILDGEIEVDVYIDKYGRINKLDYDFSSLMSGVDEFTCTMLLSKYNEAGDVMIPPSIVAGAVEETKTE